MTAIVGVFAAGRRDAQGEQLVRVALKAMHASGSEHAEVWHAPDEDAALGAVSNLWQIEGAGAEHARLAFDSHAVVAADVSLYYVADLERELRSAGELPPTSPRSPAALILAAYRAWGLEALQRIEGDFALLVWDRRQRRVLAARDHSGSRPLFYASYGGGLAVASRLDGLRTLPGFDAALDLLSLGNDALCLQVQAPEITAYANAKRIPAGHRLRWQKGGSPDADRWWDVPFFARGDGPPFTEAVEELRRLIVAAVAERTKHGGGCAVWLSGGYDSPALFAASQHAARSSSGELRPARAVSMSYPPGDPGYENDFIDAATAFWNTRTAWVDSTAIPSMEDPLARACLRDEPFFHTYELWNSALARETRAQGCRIALIGNGGDQFFSSTTARLADHLRTGRFVTLAREWREAGGGANWRLFASQVIAPNLPKRILSVAASLRQGRTPQHRLTRPVASWANRSFQYFDALNQLNNTPLERRPGESHASVDQSWTLRHVASDRLACLLGMLVLLEGIEIRSPLFDSRVVRFAAGRPLAESYSRRENKRLLRGAFRGLLPEKILGARTERTGLPVRYLKRTAVAHAAWASVEGPNGMILADLGVIDGRKFLDRVAAVPTQGLTDLEEGVALIATVQTEIWLRARKGPQ